jgi:hypothetical protein
VSSHLATGESRLLTADGGPAVLLATSGGVRLVHESLAGQGRSLRSVALDGADAADLGSLPDSLGLHPSAVHAGAAIRLPLGWILLAPDGRLPADRTTDRSQLRHVPDGVTVQLDEVTR